MAVILKINSSIPQYVRGADAAGNVEFTMDGSSALVFVDGAAATAFASGKQVFGAVQVTVVGKRDLANMSIS